MNMIWILLAFYFLPGPHNIRSSLGMNFTKIYFLTARMRENVESEWISLHSPSISSFSLLFLFIFSFSLHFLGSRLPQFVQPCFSLEIGQVRLLSWSSYRKCGLRITICSYWVLVYYVCVFVLLPHSKPCGAWLGNCMLSVFLCVHSFLQILAGKLEFGVEDQVGDEAVDHGRRWEIPARWAGWI